MNTSARAVLIVFGTMLPLVSLPNARAGFVTFNKSTQQTLADATQGLGSTHTSATTTSTLAFNVPGSLGQVIDVDVRVRLNHTNLRQLRIVLAAPNGTTVTLLENGVNSSGALILGANTASGANLDDSWFDEDTLRPITDGTAPYRARFAADLNPIEDKTPAQLSGTWELRVTDYRSGDTGTLVSWGITLKSMDTPQTFLITNLNDNGAGSLRAAVAQANANIAVNTIRFADGLSAGTIHLTTGPIEIIGGGGGVRTILEFGDPRRVTIRNAGNSRVFTVSAGRVEIHNVTIADGRSDGAEGGGGIFNASKRLDLENCTVRDNAATNAGGVARGGGLVNLGELLVTRCTFSGNAAESGAGLYTAGGDVSFYVSTFANNSATNAGAGSGGALYAATGFVSFSEMTVSANSADGVGGGVTCRPAANVSLSNSIVAANSAPAGPDLSGEFGIFSSVIGNDSGATFSSQTGGKIGTAAAPIDPLLSPLANNGGATDTMALRFGSPALDIAFCPAINGFPSPDQRGLNVVDLLSANGTFSQDYACDCGSFELSPAVFANIATRLPVETGENVLIAGFIVTSPREGATKKAFARGIGPSLQAFGITGALDDPVLELYNSGGLLVSNDNWRDAQQAEIEATGIPPASGLEAALVRSLEPTSYTAILRGNHATTGIGLVELYDFNANTTAVIANISTRGFVRTGDKVMIAGFILTGLDPARILVRGIGPSLANAGVSQPLADPSLQLFDGQGNKIAENNNWADTQAAAINATGVAPSHPLESAILADLTAGSYTAVLSGVNGGMGVAVVEAYNIR